MTRSTKGTTVTMFSRFPEVHSTPRSEPTDRPPGTTDEQGKGKRDEQKQVHPFCRGG